MSNDKVSSRYGSTIATEMPHERMNPLSRLTFKQQYDLFKRYVNECCSLRDRVKEAYLSRLEPAPPPKDLLGRVSTDHVTAKLFEALSEANFVLEAIKEIRRQDRRYYLKYPEELAGVLERVIHLKYELESNYAAHLHDARRTLHKLRQQ